MYRVSLHTNLKVYEENLKFHPNNAHVCNGYSQIAVQMTKLKNIEEVARALGEDA